MKALDYYNYELYKGNETEPLVTSLLNDKASDYYKLVCGSSYDSSVPLIPDTEYTIKVEYWTPDYKKIEKELKFKTKSYDFSDYTLEYDESYKAVRIKSNEILMGTTEASRSDSKNGEYQKIELKKNSYKSIDFYDNSNLEANKTYYYNFAITKYNSETEKYDVLYKTTEPKSVTVGKLPPKSVDSTTIKVHQGITGVKFEWNAVDDATKYKVFVKQYSAYSSYPNLVEEEVTDTVFEFDAVKYIEDFTTYSAIHFRDYSFGVYAINEAGESNTTSCKFNIALLKNCTSNL